MSRRVAARKKKSGCKGEVMEERHLSVCYRVRSYFRRWGYIVSKSLLCFDARIAAAKSAWCFPSPPSPQVGSLPAFSPRLPPTAVIANPPSFGVRKAAVEHYQPNCLHLRDRTALGEHRREAAVERNKNVTHRISPLQ